MSAAGDLTKVLNDDVVRDILIRLRCSTSLIRAAAVSKQWLRAASDQAFLRRFRRLHPPPVLGFYIETWRPRFPQFVPMPNPPAEFASAVRRLAQQRPGKGLARYTSILDCRNGRLLVTCLNSKTERAVVSPLQGERGAAVVLPLPPPPLNHPSHNTVCLDKDGSAVVACSHDYPGDSDDQATVVNVHKLQLDGSDRAWHRLASHKVELRAPRGFHLRGKLYMIPEPGDVAALHLESSTPTDPSIVKLPDGITDCGYTGRSMMSLADDDSGVYLVSLDTVQIRVWLQRTGSCWSLVDSISLSEVISEAGVPTLRHLEVPTLLAVGDNAEFVFLQSRSCVVYVHFKSRVVEKVYIVRQDKGLVKVAPFTITWPPVFPVLKEVN